jgi:BirA family biotin operon repressor/biotin-[acetyl-CoA-carboxylase] ligase
VNDRKIAGILIENFIEGDSIVKTVAGVGLNINQERFASGAPNPVSLRQLTGTIYPVEDCLCSLREYIAARYRMIAGNQDKINADYLRRLYRFGRLSRFCAAGVFFDATVTGVNRYGMLEMTTADGERKTFGFKEVTFLIDD